MRTTYVLLPWILIDFVSGLESYTCDNNSINNNSIILSKLTRREENIVEKKIQKIEKKRKGDKESSKRINSSFYFLFAIYAFVIIFCIVRISIVCWTAKQKKNEKKKKELSIEWDRVTVIYLKCSCKHTQAMRNWLLWIFPGPLLLFSFVIEIAVAHICMQSFFSLPLF